MALERYEDAYLSYAKALSLPFYSEAMGEPLFAQLQSYQKMLLVSQLITQKYGKMDTPSYLQLQYLLHFTNQQTLQNIRNNCLPYTSLIAAIEGKITDDDENKDKNTKPEKQIDNVIAQHMEKEFEPRGDMPLI